ncbi:MAG: EI24 domain-containing protein [Bdellovibrionota bacterium]
MTTLTSPPSGRLPKSSAIEAFFEGFGVAWEGYGFMKSHRGLWRYGWAPVLLNLVLSIGMLFLLYYAGSTFYHSWLPSFPEGIWGYFLKLVAILAGVVVILGVGVAVWFLLGAILCGFFYSKLARQTELLIGTPESILREVPIAYEILYAIRTVVLMLSVNLALLLTHLVPLVGSTVGFVASCYFSFFFLGWEYFDYPLALRAKTYGEKKRFVKAYRFHTLGLGASVMCFTFVPVLGAVLLTTSVVGSVLLHQRLRPL